MVEEYESIIRKIVWEVVPRPADKLVVSSIWFYKVKQATDGSVEKHKAIFVVRGFSQVEGIDYDETFSLVVRLKQALHGVKQTPDAWYTRIENYFTRLGFTKSEVYANLYHIAVEGKLLVIVLYVDDFILTGDEKLIKSCKGDLAREFEMTDMELMHYFLGMEVWKGDGELFVSQAKYANEILKKFHMERNEPMETPLAGNWRKEDCTSCEVVEATIYRQLMGSIMYLVNTRLNMCFAVNHLSQDMVNPTKLYWKETKNVLRYLRGTTQFCLWYRWTEGVKLQEFTYADWGGSPFDRKNTSGGIFSIGSAVIFWYNRKQRSGALSSTEVEYMDVSQETCEAIWMRNTLVGLFGQQMDPIVIYCDNQSCIKLSKNPVFHDWSKHIDIRYHHLQDCV
eukprot:PITA_03267